jgi:hypothetical protein
MTDWQRAMFGDQLDRLRDLDAWRDFLARR